MKENPCIDCEDRHFGCHIGCEREEQYQAEEKPKRDKIRAAKDEEMMLDGFRRDGIRKAVRRRRK